MKAMQPLYRDRNWLYKHYIILQESTNVMAREAGCGHTTILDWLHKFNIPIRTRRENTLLQNARGSQLYRNEDWLCEHYIGLQESARAMAREADCDHQTILNWLHIFNIPTRSIFEALRNYLNISPELLDLVEGELLGDGCITMHGSRSALYSHSSKYKEYLEWLSKKLANLGLEQVGKINKYWNEEYETFVYEYTSRSYPELVPIRQRFYPNGKKIVPKDLILTPIMARHWYIGDGCLENKKKGCASIYFSTCDFDKASIDYLLEELGGKGFIVSHRPSNNTIGMSVYSVKDFLSWIGSCPKEIESIYGYKWRY